MKRYVLATALVACSLGIEMPAAAQTAPKKAETAKEKDIRKLMHLTGAGEIGVEMIKQMIGSFKQALPAVPAEFWDAFVKEAKADTVVDLVVPIYDKHFTHQEIKDILKFYDTPTGKKFVKELPALTQESMVVGQKWGLELMSNLDQKLKAKGYK